jgi:hypothetical protein
MNGSHEGPAEDYTAGPMPALRPFAYVSRMDVVTQLSEVTKRYDNGARPAPGRVSLMVAPRETGVPQTQCPYRQDGLPRLR